jgi:hypothetical protein
MAGFIGLFDTARLRFTVHYYALLCTVTSSLPLPGSGLQRQTFRFLLVPELSPASATSFSQQRFTTTEPQQFSQLLTLTNSLTATESESESDLLYDWLFATNQFVLAPSSLRFMTRDFFFQLNPCGHSPYVTSSLTRRRVRLLWICLAFRQVYVSHI